MLPLHSEPHGQHSMVLPAGQPYHASTHAAVRRYGPVLCGHGYTAVPNEVLAHYAELGVSEGELVFIQQVWVYWWDETLPFPSVTTLAVRMGKSVRQIQHYIARLRALGLLRVVERRGARGGQLTNAYDLRPFLEAIERLVRREREHGGESLPRSAPRKAAHGAMRAPAEPEGGRDLAPEGARDASPKLDERGADPRSISISMPPTPASGPTRRPPSPAAPRARPGGSAIRTDAPSGDSASPPRSQGGSAPTAADSAPGERASEALRASMKRLGGRLGDSAPRSSLTRARRLQTLHRLEDATFLTVLEEVGRTVHAALPRVRRRGAAGGVNAMPYFLASLEERLAEDRRPTVGGGRRPRGRPRGRGRPTANADACRRREAPRPTGIPLWDLVRAELWGMLAPAVFDGRVSPLGARLDPDGALVLEAPTTSMAMWLDARLRARIEQILAAAGADVPRVLVTVAHPAPTDCVVGAEHPSAAGGSGG